MVVAFVEVFGISSAGGGVEISFLAASSFLGSSFFRSSFLASTVFVSAGLSFFTVVVPVVPVVVVVVAAAVAAVVQTAGAIIFLTPLAASGECMAFTFRYPTTSFMPA